MALGGGFLLLLAIAIMLLWRGLPTDESSSGDVVTVPTPR
jgi:hypothetical protein